MKKRIKKSLSGKGKSFSFELEEINFKPGLLSWKFLSSYAMKNISAREYSAGYEASCWFSIIMITLFYIDILVP
jgi:hypothetical protein